MVKHFIFKVLTLLSIPCCLIILLAPFGLLIGWNIYTLLLYWFILTPALAEYLPTIFSENKSLLRESLMGMMIFYLFMALMIYQHYQSDWFSMMMVSCVINLATVSVISRVKKVYRESPI